MKRKRHRTTNIGAISRLLKIFEKKGWQIDNQASNTMSSFNRFCELFEHLNSEQKNLLCMLAEVYLRLKVEKYPSTLRRALSEISVARLRQIDTIYIVPIIAPEDANKNKSSGIVARLFYDPDIKAHNKISSINTHVKDGPEVIPANAVSMNNVAVLFVDDFIGSGEKAIAAINAFRQIRCFDQANMIILSLIAQERGMRALQEQGYYVVSAIVANRGISDRYIDPQKGEYYSGPGCLDRFLYRF